MDQSKKKCIGHKLDTKIDEKNKLDNLKEEFADVKNDNLILSPIQKSFVSHWELLAPAAPPRPTQISIGHHLIEPQTWPRKVLGEGWHIHGGIGNRDILGHKSKIQPPYPRSHRHFGSVLTPEPSNLFTSSELKRSSSIPPPQNCGQLVRCVFDKYSIIFPKTGRLSREKVFPRDSRFEYRQLPPPEPPKEIPIDPQSTKKTRRDERIGIYPPFWYLDPEKGFTRDSLGSYNDYSTEALISEKKSDESTMVRLVKEYELDKEGNYIPGRIEQDDQENIDSKKKPQGYISRLEDIRDFQDSVESKDPRQKQIRKHLCLCPLIHEIEKGSHSESCLKLDKGPPQAGTYPEKICAHLKSHRSPPKPIRDLQWVGQPYKHCAQNLIYLKYPSYKPPIITAHGKRAFPEMVFSNIM